MRLSKFVLLAAVVSLDVLLMHESYGMSMWLNSAAAAQACCDCQVAAVCVCKRQALNGECEEDANSVSSG